MARILITIPTWNEARVIEQTLTEVSAAIQMFLPDHDVRVEIADNGSTDGTPEIVRAHAMRPSGMPAGGRVAHAPTILSLSQKGKGLAIRGSWERHLKDADILLFMDADLAADLAYLPALVRPILDGKVDLVCGSRFVPGAKAERRLSREIASRAYRHLQRIFLRLPVQDAQCGFKAISSTLAVKLLPHCRETGWMFDSELIAMAAVQKARIREIPVQWIEHRNPGRRSAISLFRNGWGFLLGLAKIKARIGLLG